MFSPKRIYGFFTSNAGPSGEWTAPMGRDTTLKYGAFDDADIVDASYVVFDTELTGLRLKNDSIVSIGAVKMVGGRIEIGQVFYRTVRPRTTLSGGSVVIHGITPTEAAESPDIDILLPELISFCGDSILVGHFVSIDIGFINKEMRRLHGADIRNPAVDTGNIYKWLQRHGAESCAFQGEAHEDISLRALASKYGICVNGVHNALTDAFITAQIFQRFLSELRSRGIKKIGDLVRIGRPLKS